MLAESISNALKGKRSGNAYYVRAICHGSEKTNLKISDAPDGRLYATCFSQHCDYATIMAALEAAGLKEKTKFNKQDRRVYAIRKSRYERMRSLDHEITVYEQWLHAFFNLDIARRDAYFNENKQRILMAANKIRELLGHLHGIY